MTYLAFALNLPWTLLAVIQAAISLPTSVKIHTRPFALIISVRSFWNLSWLSSYKGTRALTQGAVVLLGPNILPTDLAHELIHIEQLRRTPFIHPFLYGLEARKHGHGPANKYEYEAYSRSHSTYLGIEKPTEF
jgi:hypothetical protein